MPFLALCKVHLLLHDLLWVRLGLPTAAAADGARVGFHVAAQQQQHRRRRRQHPLHFTVGRSAPLTAPAPCEFSAQIKFFFPSRAGLLAALPPNKLLHAEPFPAPTKSGLPPPSETTRSNAAALLFLWSCRPPPSLLLLLRGRSVGHGRGGVLSVPPPLPPAIPQNHGTRHRRCAVTFARLFHNFHSGKGPSVRPSAVPLIHFTWNLCARDFPPCLHFFFIIFPLIHYTTHTHRRRRRLSNFATRQGYHVKCYMYLVHAK